MNLLRYATKFYKSLYGEDNNSTFIHLDVHLPCVLDDSDIEKLVSAFTLDEIKVALFHMKHNKSSCPDGLPAEFYQYFWHLLGGYLLHLFNKYGRIDLTRLNYGLIALITKCPGANMLKMFKPIYRTNVSVKLITKVVNNRNVLLASKIAALIQTTIIKIDLSLKE